MEQIFKEAKHPQQKLVEGAPFPLILSPSSYPELNTFCQALRDNKSWIQEQLLRSGAIIFRGFNVQGAADFNSLVTALGYEDFGYVGGAAARNRVLGAVYTANELPLEYEIGFHNEMSYLPENPKFLMFFCEIPPPEGGITAIVRGQVVYERVKKEMPELLDQLEHKGLIYYNVLEEHGENGWKMTFQTPDRLQAEERAKKQHKSLVWLPEGGVKVMHGPCIAVKYDEHRGHKVWFNNIGASIPQIPNIKNLAFGDGSNLPIEFKQAALKIMKEEQVCIPWNKGDVMLVDNTAVLHSRQPSKPPRRVLVSMCRN